MKLFCKHIFYELYPLIDDGAQGLAESPTDKCVKCGAKRKYWSRRHIEYIMWELIQKHPNKISRMLETKGRPKR